MQYLSKPHYVLRPTQLVRRALTDARGASEPLTRAAWGGRMRVSRRDSIGGGIVRTGVHELGVSEVIWRLTEPTDLAIDVGANIGYFSGLLAVRAREVIALEPNPQAIRLLTANRLHWRAAGRRVVLDDRAVSDRPGTAVLHLPADFASNGGTATLVGDGDGATSYEVRTVTLDELIDGRLVGMLKIDVEGHELAALHGARHALAAGLVREIVFEDHDPLPSPVSSLLESNGFSVFGIEESFLGPRLIAPMRPPRGWDAPTYLATRRPDRAARLMSSRGWRVLYPRLSRARDAR